MKKLPILCFTALFACITPLRAQQAPSNSNPNPYDTLSRVLTPLASIFSPEAEKHALSATFVLEEMSGMPPGLSGASFDVLLEPPVRFLVRTNYNGTPVTVCRNGDFIWISPNVPPFSALANPPTEGAPHKKKKNASGLGPMVLPFPPQQLALLPMLFQVREAASTQGLRNLEIRLMPELAKNLGVEEWCAQLALTPAEKPQRLRLIGPGWSMSLKVANLEVMAGLPPETWKAPEGAILLDAPKVEAWMSELSRRVDTYRPTPNR
jgi:hypothetical protein